MIQWDEDERLLMADTIDEVASIAHASGPRQIGLMQEDDLWVFLVSPSGEVELTHHPDHWGVPAWFSEETSNAND
jgi:hypothetical protein